MPLLAPLSALIACQTVAPPAPPMVTALGRLPGGALQDLRVSADGRHAAVGSQEGVSVFDTESGAERWSGATPRWALQVRPTADGARVAVGLDEGGVQVWRIGDPTPMTEIRLDRGASDLALSPDGRTLATATWSPELRLWDAETGAPGPALVGPDDVVALAFRPDGGALAALGRGGGWTVWSLDGARLASADGSYAGARALVWSPDGAEIAALHARGVQTWTADGAPGRALTLDAGVGKALAWAADGRIAVGTDGGGVTVWGAEGAPTRLAADASAVRGLGFAADGALLVGASAVGRWADGRRAGGLAFAGAPQRAAWSEHELALADGAAITRWGLDPSTLPGAVGLDDPSGHLDSLAFSPDGQTLYAGSTRAIGGWAARSLQPVFAMTAQDGERLHGPAVGPRGLALVRARAGGQDSQGRGQTGSWAVELLDAQGARILQGEAQPGSARVDALAWSPSGDRLAAAINGAAHVWSEALKPLSARPRLASGPTSLVWAGARLLSASSDRRTLAIWEPDTGRDAFTITETLGAAGAALLACDAAGRLAAVAVNGKDGAEITLIDLGRGAARHRDLPQAGRTALSLALSPDGALLAAGFHDAENQGSLVVWATATGAVILREASAQGPVGLVSFSPDGRTLVSGGRGGVRLWRVQPSDQGPLR